MSKITTKLNLMLLLLLGLQTVAQSTYHYNSREYYTYSESKKMLVKDATDKVSTTLTINDQKRVILYSISKPKEVITFSNLIVKGIVSSSKDRPFLHYVYKGEDNHEVHFYISKESARIESYSSMLLLLQ